MSAQPTIESYRPTTRPRLRLLPPPISEPEPVPRTQVRQPDAGPEHPTLALEPSAGRRPPSTMVFGAGAGGSAAERAAGNPDLPDPHRVMAALAPAVVEVLAGSRPASQLVRWTTHDVHSALTRRAAVGARLRRGPVTSRPPVVRAVRVCRPDEGVAEASAVVIDADRIRAVAVRLEATRGRWQATALEVG